ncbi:hypothetical protein Scep_014709 [Stephania cephalantha]|uniref:Uncharacterized protein n=1 Tax=Stephania cephalantha TaxID=152367 RepID=A0AAP0J1U4_9MAGN
MMASRRAEARTAIPVREVAAAITEVAAREMVSRDGGGGDGGGDGARAATPTADSGIGAAAAATRQCDYDDTAAAAAADARGTTWSNGVVARCGRRSRRDNNDGQGVVTSMKLRRDGFKWNLDWRPH